MPIKEWIEIIEVSNPKTVSKKGAVSLRKSKKTTKPKTKLPPKQEEQKTWWNSEQERLEEEYRNITSSIKIPLPKEWTPEYLKLLKKYKLTIKQERFCRIYALHQDFFGNATQSYITAFKTEYYRPEAYNTARTESCRLLTSPNIMEYINYLLDNDWFNDEFADKSLLFLMKQFWDLWVKRASLRDYNELKWRIKQKVEVGIDDSLKSFLDKIRNSQK